MKMKTRKSLTGIGLILPLLIGCLIFYALPFGMVTNYSLFSGSGYSQHFAGLSNYTQLMENELFRTALGNTLWFLVAGLVLILVISYAIALFIKTKTQRHSTLQSVLLLPYVMPVDGYKLFQW